MPLTLTTQITINASPEEIWTELIDFKSYPEWNPFINKIEGIPLKGNKLKATMGVVLSSLKIKRRPFFN